MLLARLRWSAFGLRGRIVGVVVMTTAVSLGVAALVLLPRLENSLKTASQKTLAAEVNKSKATRRDVKQLAAIDYPLIAFSHSAAKGSELQRSGAAAVAELEKVTKRLSEHFGNANVTLVGDIDVEGHGYPVLTSSAEVNELGGALGSTGDISKAYRTGRTEFSFGTVGSQQVVRAAIPLHGADAVLAVRKPIDEIPGAVAAVRSAFELAALVAILLTVVFAIPLAGRLVRRLQRLRQRALELAIGGHVEDLPIDRAHDEVGDLARSFSIMQRRLRQQEEARRAFVATASHELRTPLASLNGMLELLADDLQGGQVDTDDAVALLARARAQSRRLARLAADLLDLSRIDAEVGLRSEPVELGELGRAVLAEFELASQARGVGLVLEGDAASAWALADPGSVARILRILIDNALRVAPPDSEVRVEVRAQPEPTLIVKDHGPGVASEERGLIFDRFKRGRETGGEAGFGLGLAIGRELAERMGGTLTLADADGPGATFALRLRHSEAPTPEHTTSAAGV